MHANSLAMADPLSWDGHLRIPPIPIHELPQRCGGEVAENGILAKALDRGEKSPFASYSWVPDGIYLTVDPV
jgi:hypothetical protein